MRVSYSAASPASHTANGLWKLSSKEKRLARIWPLQPVPAHSRTLPRSNTTPRRSTWPKAFLHQAWTSSRRREGLRHSHPSQRGMHSSPQYVSIIAKSSTSTHSAQSLTAVKRRSTQLVVASVCGGNTLRFASKDSPRGVIHDCSALDIGALKLRIYLISRGNNALRPITV